MTDSPPDWLKIDTPAQAVDWLDQQLDHAADEARDWIVRECQLSEDDQHAAMQRVYRCLDEAREKALREIAQAFSRLENTVH